MAEQVIMPQMGFDMREGRLVRWLKKPGDRVEKGEALAEIETDKATVELEAFASGRLVELLVEEGTTVPVGEPVALLEAAPAAGPEAVTPAAAASPPARNGETQGTAGGARAVATNRGAPDAESGQGYQGRASSVARQMAGEKGIDLSQVQGSGPGGRVLGRDLEVERPAAGYGAALQEPPARPAGPSPGSYTFEPSFHDPAHYLDVPTRQAADLTSGQTLGEQPFAAPPSTVTFTGLEPAGAPPAPAAGGGQAPASPATDRQPAGPAREVKPWSRMRQAIARRMIQSKREIPHFYESVQVVMDQALAFRVDLNERLTQEDRITVNDLLVRAAALALEEFPNLNGSYTDEGLRLNPTVDVAIAVAVEDGLLTPVVRDCNAMDLVELAREVHRVIRAARKGRLKPEEYAGGTFTVSNLGMFGVDAFSAIINPPHTAILAAGGARQLPWVVGGQIQPATVMTLTVAADHRVTDGVEVARFLNRIREFLERPWLLVNPRVAR